MLKKNVECLQNIYRGRNINFPEMVNFLSVNQDWTTKGELPYNYTICYDNVKGLCYLDDERNLSPVLIHPTLLICKFELVPPKKTKTWHLCSDLIDVLDKFREGKLISRWYDWVYSNNSLTIEEFLEEIIRWRTEDIKWFYSGLVDIHCVNDYEAKKLLNFLSKKGYCWIGGKFLESPNIFFQYYGADTFYRVVQASNKRIGVGNMTGIARPSNPVRYSDIISWEDEYNE